MARIAIVGVGAIGAIVASSLSRAGRHELVLCTRRPLARLTVDTPTGPVEVKATFVSDPAKAPVVDWVVVATKAYDAVGAATWFGRLREHGAPVVVLQNGVEHRARFAPYVPDEALLPGMVDCPAERDSPEKVRQRGIMRIRVPEGAKGRAFCDLFGGTDVDAVTTPDIVTTLWRKLCGNSVGILNAIVLRATEVMHEDAIAEVAHGMVRECVLVGRAEGAKLDDDVPEAVIKAMRGAPPDSLNSLHADRLAGRTMEIDGRNGAILRAGRKHGIPTPLNFMAVALLEATVRGPAGRPKA